MITTCIACQYWENEWICNLFNNATVERRYSSISNGDSFNLCQSICLKTITYKLVYQWFLGLYYDVYEKSRLLDQQEYPSLGKFWSCSSSSTSTLGNLIILNLDASFLNGKKTNSCMAYDLALRTIVNWLCSIMFLCKWMDKDKSYNHWEVEEGLLFIAALLLRINPFVCSVTTYYTLNHKWLSRGKSKTKRELFCFLKVNDIHTAVSTETYLKPGF